jgi:SH3 domain protein
LSNGKEGWVLSRFLTSREPASIKLAELEKEHQQLLETFQTLKTDNELLKEENQRLQDELHKTQDKLDHTSKAYETLKKKSANFFTLETNYNEAITKLDQQTKKASHLESRLQEKNVKWFLSGAGVLLTGFVIGLMFKGQRRKSSLLS